MATTELQVSNVFPVGTVVGAYQVWDPPPQGSIPSGTPVSATVLADGSVTFRGLDDGLPYVAAALVDGKPRAIHFESGGRVWDSSETALDSEVRAAISAAKAQFAVNVLDYVRPDSTADQSAALNRWLGAAAGGVAYLAEGTFYGAGLAASAGTTIVGPGALKYPANGTDPYLLACGANVTLDGIEVDGNKAAFAAANPTADPDAANYPAALVIFGNSNTATDTPGATVRDCYIHDSFRLGLVFQNCSNLAALNNRVSGNNRDGITWYFNCPGFRVEGNRIHDFGDDALGCDSGNDTVTGLCENGVIAGNVVTGPCSRLKGRGLFIRGGRNIAVVGNVFRDVASTAIHVGDFNTAPAEDILIADNVIDRSGYGQLNPTTNNEPKFGIYVRGGHDDEHPPISGSRTYAYIRGVTIKGNRISRTGGGVNNATNASGIVVENARSSGAGDDQVYDISIIDNQVRDSARRGVSIATVNVNDVTVRGNRVSAPYLDGINCSVAAKRVFIEHNIVSRSVTGKGIVLDTVAGGSLLGNKAYDDRGGSATQTDGIVAANLTGDWSWAHNASWGNVANNWAVSALSGVTWRFKQLRSSKSWSTGSIANGASLTTTVTVAGAAVGDTVLVELSGIASIDWAVVARVLTAGQVTVKITNNTGGAVDPTGTLRAEVFGGSAV